MRLKTSKPDKPNKSILCYQCNKEIKGKYYQAVASKRVFCNYEKCFKRDYLKVT